MSDARNADRPDPLARGRRLTDWLVMNLAAGASIGFAIRFTRSHGHYLDDVAGAEMTAGAAFLMTGMAMLVAVALMLALFSLAALRGALAARAPSLPGPALPGLAVSVVAYGLGVVFIAFLVAMTLFLLA